MPWLYPLFPFQLLSALPTAKEPLVQKTEFVFPLAWPAAVGFHGVGPHPIPPGPMASRERLFLKPQSCKNLPFLFFIRCPPPHPVVVMSFISLCPSSSVLSLRNGGLCQASANSPLRGMWVSVCQMVMGPDTSLREKSLCLISVVQPHPMGQAMVGGPERECWCSHAS